MTMIQLRTRLRSPSPDLEIVTAASKAGIMPQQDFPRPFRFEP